MNTHDLDSWKTLAVEESRCFPQHLQIALYAMMERGRNTMSLGDSDEGPIREECAAGRDAYYRGRGELLEADGRDMANEVLRTLQGERYAKDAAAKAIEKFGRGGEDGWTPKALIEKMVHAGLLQHDRDDEYVEGIPSFTEWLGKECAARAARKRTA